MPFYALVQPLTGDIVDVVRWLDGPVPEGLVVIELPARGDDLRRWLTDRARKGGGGGPGDTLFLEREAAGEGERGAPKPQARDADAFFARLEVELLRADASGRHLGLLLVEVAAVDREDAAGYATRLLESHGQDLLPCDLVARLREHLVVVLMPNVDAHELAIQPERGAVHALTYPRDREEIEFVRRRKHPLLRRPLYRAS